MKNNANQSPGNSEVVDTARTYYNSDDADTFYAAIWGGEDIHIGLYQSPDESIFEASRRTVERMAEELGPLDAPAHVLDLGAGYGGSARYLATRSGCHVECLNLSEVQNKRNQEMNEEQKLDSLIKVTDGNFESIPSEDASFDFVWSQDAILHSGDRKRVIAETYRVLKPGGVFIFTDIMRDDACPLEKLKPVLDRIHLDSLGSPQFYRDTAAELGMEELGFSDLSEQLPAHYGRVRAEVIKQRGEIEKLCSPDYIARMIDGLQSWVDNGNQGNLKWGIFRFRKS